jgi:hypothetical protein
MLWLLVLLAVLAVQTQNVVPSQPGSRDDYWNLSPDDAQDKTIRTAKNQCCHTFFFFNYLAITLTEICSKANTAISSAALLL